MEMKPTEETLRFSPVSFDKPMERQLLVGLGLTNQMITKFVLTIDPNQCILPIIEVTIIPTEEQLQNIVDTVNTTNWMNEEKKSD